MTVKLETLVWDATHNQIAMYPSGHMTFIQRRINVERQDVDSTFVQRCFNVVCPLEHLFQIISL